MNLIKILEYALQREYEGRDFFRNNAKRFGHAAVVGVFEELAKEEEKRIAFIQRLIDSAQGGSLSAEAVGQDMEKEGFFSERAKDELLDQTIIESMVPDLAVLRTAYLIERDFAEFYEMSAGRVQDASVKAALEMMASWERTHEQLFKKLHDQAFEQYAQMPWGG